MITLADAKAFLYQYADGGLDIADPRLVARINEAEERLMQKMNPVDTIRGVCICSDQSCLTLGRDMEKLMKCRIDGAMAYPWPKWYEYMEGGPGLLADGGSGWVDPLDRGMVVTQYDLTEPAQIMVFSDQEECAGTTMRIRGYDETNREVWHSGGTNTDDQWGELVPITSDVGIYTRSSFSKITAIEKPVTRGYVYLHGFDPSTGDRLFLSAFHPHETRPHYRRYAIPQNDNCPCDGVDYTNTYHRINALVKMKHVPLVVDSDVLFIDSLPAMKFMLMAMRRQDSGDLEGGEPFEAKAMQLLSAQLTNWGSLLQKLNMPVDSVGLGEVTNVQ